MTSLGERIKEARLQREMTQRALAVKAGFTAAFLSQVERNRVMPSVITLQKISQILEIPIGHLVEEPPDTSPVVRKDERMSLRLPYAKVDRECLTPGLNHRLEVFEVRLEPGERSSEQVLSHPSEEFILVLEGSLEVELDGETHRLEAGDTILYNGILPHRTQCAGADPAKYIVVNTPPAI